MEGEAYKITVSKRTEQNASFFIPSLFPMSHFVIHVVLSDCPVKWANKARDGRGAEG